MTQLVKVNARLGAAHKIEQHTDAFLLLEKADDAPQSPAPAAQLDLATHAADAGKQLRFLRFGVRHDCQSFAIIGYRV